MTMILRLGVLSLIPGLLGSWSLTAQEMAPPEMIQTIWIKPGALLFQDPYGGAPEMEELTPGKQGRSILSKKAISGPKDDSKDLTSFVDVHDGSWWMVQQSSAQATPDHPQVHVSTSLFRSRDQKTWELVGQFRQSWSSWVNILPLSGNRFFAHFSGLHPKDGVELPAGFAPFALLKLN